MSVALITGMSGAGKSSVLSELSRRGHSVVDTDHGGYIEDVVVPGQLEPEPLWRGDRIDALLDGHAEGHLFVAGTVANQGLFYSRFDAVVLLTAPIEVLLARVRARTTNPFGQSPEDRDRIVRDTMDVEPLLRRGATHEIDTRSPLEDVIATLLTIADGPGLAERRRP